MRERLPSPAALVRAGRPAYLADLVEAVAAGRPLADEELQVVELLLRQRPGVDRELERRAALREVARVRAAEPGTSFRAAAEVAARRLGGSARTIRWWAAEGLLPAHAPGDGGVNPEGGDR